jgi:hypothetical protein
MSCKIGRGGPEAEEKPEINDEINTPRKGLMIMMMMVIRIMILLMMMTLLTMMMMKMVVVIKIMMILLNMMIFIDIEDNDKQQIYEGFRWKILFRAKRFRKGMRVMMRKQGLW